MKVTLKRHWGKTKEFPESYHMPILYIGVGYGSFAITICGFNFKFTPNKTLLK
jgi:hypothetical protein